MTKGDQESETGSSRATCEVHGLAVGDDDRCVLCRREERPSRAELPLVQIVSVVAGAVLLGLIVYAVVKYGGFGDENVVAVADPSTADPPESEVAEEEPTVGTRRGNRTGARGRHRKPGRTRSSRRSAPGAADPNSTGATDGSREAGHEAREQQDQKRDREVEILKEMRRVPIKMYMTRWCPVCTKARVWLKASGYRFTEYDVDADQQARRAQKRLNPAGSVPTLDIEGEVLIGFSASRIERVLRQRAKRRLGI